MNLALKKSKPPKVSLSKGDLCPCFLENLFSLKLVSLSFCRLYHTATNCEELLEMAALSEELLLKSYNVCLPTTSSSLMGAEDANAKAILESYHPALLKEYKPLSVIGDGNCLDRAISHGLYGTEHHHHSMRLLAAYEIAKNRQFYDTSDPHFVDLIKDQYVVFDSYTNLLTSVSRNGGSNEMLHMFATSAALSCAFQSYCPPVIPDHFMSRPFTRKVCGRGVLSSSIPSVTLMWSRMSLPEHQHDFVPNHIVVL